jgi:hypothetical protein
MKHRKLLLCCVLIIAGGCAANSPHSTTPTSIQPAIASPRLFSMEVRYDLELHPDALTSQQNVELLQQASERATSEPRLWFVHVRYNKRGIFAANLYFTPDAASPRIRKGFCAHVESWADLLSVLREGPSDHAPRYAQISNPQEPFDHCLNVPSGDMMPFEPDRHFFGKAVELGDDDLVALVDLVRPVFARNGGGPIFGIEAKEDMIRVFSGASHGPLSGGGRFVDVKRKAGGGFELADENVGSWAS